MPTKGIYTALSGAIAHGERLDTIANNIANVNTPAFKKDQQVFREYLTVHQKLPDVIQVPKVPASIESFYDMQGGDKAYVDNAGTFTDFSQGPIKQTGQALDFAINGEGLFEILTPQGIQYSRNGSFKVDNSGRLVTSQGYPVLRQQTEPGSDPTDRVIQLQNRTVNVSENGEIFQNNQSLGRLSVVGFGNPDVLHKVGNSTYTLRANIDPQAFIPDNYEIRQGYVESSNVNIVQEMTDMIKASRIFESTQKAIKAYDQMNGKLVNEIPRLG